MDSVCFAECTGVASVMWPVRMPKRQLDGSKALIVPVLPALLGLQLLEKIGDV